MRVDSSCPQLVVLAAWTSTLVHAQSPVVGTDILVNGDFQTVNSTNATFLESHWGCTGINDDPGVTSWGQCGIDPSHNLPGQPHSGSHNAFVFIASTIFQSLNGLTVAGAAYEVGFWAYCIYCEGRPNNVIVGFGVLNDPQRGIFRALAQNDPNANGYTQFSHTFTARGNDILSFSYLDGDAGNPGYQPAMLRIDSVTLTLSALVAPTPAPPLSSTNQSPSSTTSPPAATVTVTAAAAAGSKAGVSVGTTVGAAVGAAAAIGLLAALFATSMARRRAAASADRPSSEREVGSEKAIAGAGGGTTSSGGGTRASSKTATVASNTAAWLKTLFTHDGRPGGVFIGGPLDVSPASKSSPLPDRNAVSSPPPASTVSAAATVERPAVPAAPVGAHHRSLSEPFPSTSSDLSDSNIVIHSSSDAGSDLSGGLRRSNSDQQQGTGSHHSSFYSHALAPILQSPVGPPSPYQPRPRSTAQQPLMNALLVSSPPPQASIPPPSPYRPGPAGPIEYLAPQDPAQRLRVFASSPDTYQQYRAPQAQGYPPEGDSRFPTYTK